MLTTGTVAEVLSSNQNRSTAKRLLIQNELRLLGPVGFETPVKEKELPKPRAFDPLQELLGDNLVRIDIGSIQRCDNSGVLCEGFHDTIITPNASPAIHFTN